MGGTGGWILIALDSAATLRYTFMYIQPLTSCFDSFQNIGVTFVPKQCPENDRAKLAEI